MLGGPARGAERNPLPGPERPRLADAASPFRAVAWGVPYVRTLDMLRAEIVDRLKSGELVATGFEDGTPADAAPKVIRADRWHVLQLDFDTSSATGTGLRLTNIRVSVAASTQNATADDVGSSGPRATDVAFVIRRGAREVSFGPRKVAISDRPFRLLMLLAEAATGDRGAVSRQEIEKHVWGNAVVSTKACADAIRDLRLKLAKVLPRSLAVQSVIASRQPAAYVLDLDPRQIQIDPE
jgi:hypothetical protein